MADSLIDIVMVVHSQFTWADLALRAIEHHTKNPYRLIIVNSGAIDPRVLSVFADAKRRGHTVLDLAENRSFSSAVNAGVELGSAKFIAILNDDAIVTEGWDAVMVQDVSERFTGLVGARSNFASGAQGNPAFTGEPPYLVFVAVMLRREIWNIVGPLDAETFDGFSSEDLDYSWRVVRAGYKLKVSGAFVLHAGSRSLSVAMDAAARQRNDAKYNARLLDKWGKDWVAAHSKLEGRGLVVTYHAEEMTRVEFMKNLMGLRRSDGVGFSYIQISRVPIAMARNSAADYALDNGFDWLVQLDDDATFPSDVLRRLLSHGKDVVCALAYQRKPPHFTCAFELGPDGLLGSPMEGIEHTGLRRVDISGFHCSIMRTSVIKKLRDAGIKQYYGGFDNKIGEDFAMSINMKKVGVFIHVDTELISGHIGSSIIVDEAYKREWKVRNP